MPRSILNHFIRIYNYSDRTERYSYIISPSTNLDLRGIRFCQVKVESNWFVVKKILLSGFNFPPHIEIKLHQSFPLPNHPIDVVPDGHNSICGGLFFRGFYE